MSRRLKGSVNILLCAIAFGAISLPSYKVSAQSVDTTASCTDSFIKTTTEADFLGNFFYLGKTSSGDAMEQTLNGLVLTTEEEAAENISGYPDTYSHLTSKLSYTGDFATQVNVTNFKVESIYTDVFVRANLGVQTTDRKTWVNVKVLKSSAGLYASMNWTIPGKDAPTDKKVQITEKDIPLTLRLEKKGKVVTGYVIINGTKQVIDKIDIGKKVPFRVALTLYMRNSLLAQKATVTYKNFAVTCISDTPDFTKTTTNNAINATTSKSTTDSFFEEHKYSVLGAVVLIVVLQLLLWGTIFATRNKDKDQVNLGRRSFDGRSEKFPNL